MRGRFQGGVDKTALWAPSRCVPAAFPSDEGGRRALITVRACLLLLSWTKFANYHLVASVISKY